MNSEQLEDQIEEALIAAPGVEQSAAPAETVQQSIAAQRRANEATKKTLVLTREIEEGTSQARQEAILKELKELINVFVRENAVARMYWQRVLREHGAEDT